jgi:hypothetical protein
MAVVLDLARRREQSFLGNSKLSFGQSTIGWFMLSEADRAASARLLAQSAAEDTRDDLGFGVIHFAYSDRFFPGTSVQHNRLRYVFFLTWTYQELLALSAGKPFPKEALAEIERRTAVSLMASFEDLQNSGIVGWNRYLVKRAPVVPASEIYWNALKTWGLLNPVGALTRPPTRSELHGRWPSLVDFGDGDDGKASLAPLFDDEIPPPPAVWTKRSSSLDFRMTGKEASYVKRKWRAIRSPGETKPPLLSRLADAGVHGVSMWHPEVLSLAEGEELRALKRSRLAASLVCIGRAIHAALVESERNRDHKTDDRHHAYLLEGRRKVHETRACALNLGLLRDDVKMTDDLFDLLRATQKWAKDGGSVKPLFAQFRDREFCLKKSLAFLASPERRDGWSRNDARPLEYRWPKVDALLGDLARAP